MKIAIRMAYVCLGVFLVTGCMQSGNEKTPEPVTPSADGERPFDPTGAMKGSEFLAAVKDQFFKSDESSNWPGQPNDTQGQRAQAELPVAVDALFRCAAFDEDLPDADSNTALGKLKAAADATGWPDTSKIPDTWPAEQTETYRLYEVSYAVNLMMRAYSSRGGGGGPRTFPPPVNP